MTWDNEDGILVRFGTERSTVSTDGTDAGHQEHVLEVVIDSQDILLVGDVNDDRPSLPANAVVTDALLIATTAFVGTGTLTLGLSDSAGSAIDADGIDATIDVDAVLGNIGDVVACDGALVDKTASIGTVAGWVYGSIGGTVSAGVATLKLKYVV